MKLFNVSKIIINSILILVFLMTVPLTVNAGFKFDEGGKIKSGTGLGSADVQTVMINIISYILGFLGLLFLSLLIYGGFAWLFAGGNDDKIKKARGIIINAALGLLIVAASYGIAKFVFEAVVSTTNPAPTK